MSEKIVVERTYRAAVEELWALWTTKEGFESWWGPEGFRVEVHAIEARLGGTLRYDMIAETPEAIEAMKRMWGRVSNSVRARFGAFQPLERLMLNHMIDFVPGVKPYEGTIDAAFFPSGNRVRMVVTVHSMHDAEFTRLQQMGFESQLTKLDRRFDR